MAVWLIECPDCGHRYQSLVMEGTTPPMVWCCSHCGGCNAMPLNKTTDQHPLEQAHSGGCPCCGVIKLRSRSA
jgi:hypothetical protein